MQLARNLRIAEGTVSEALDRAEHLKQPNRRTVRFWVAANDLYVTIARDTAMKIEGTAA